MKKLGLLILLGAAAAGAAYLIKKQNEEKQEITDDVMEFDGVQENDIDPEDSVEARKPAKTMKQKYISLSDNKDDFVDAAKNTLQAAKGMIEPIKGMAGDVKDIIVEKAGDAGIVAGDYYNDAKEKVEEVIGQAREKLDNIKLDSEDDDVMIDIEIAEDEE